VDDERHREADHAYPAPAGSRWAKGSAVVRIGRRTHVGTIVAVAILGVLAAGAARAAPVPAAMPDAVSTARSAADQMFYWRWSDGSQAKERTFRRSTYRVPENLPRLIVSAYPARPSRAVDLQYLDGSTWRTDDRGRTDARGSVRLALNPYCPDGSWCAATVSYRARAAGRTTSFLVTYAP